MSYICALMRWLFLFAFLGKTVLVSSQDAQLFKPDSVRKLVQTGMIGTNLRIDGFLNEPEWQSALKTPSFVMIEPRQGEHPSQPTDVRVLFSRQYLFIGVFAADSLGKNAIRVNQFKRDFNLRNQDNVSISIDGFNDKRNAMVFATDPYGTQLDMLSFDDRYYDMDWDGLWKVRTHRTDSGWYAEMAIPWYSLRYPKSRDTVQSWGINIARNRRYSNEWSAMSPFPRSFSFLRMEYAGEIKGLKPPPPKANIRVQPYVLNEILTNKTEGQATLQKSQFRTGGEVKWAVSPNAVLDLTFNTDFAQADVDRQVNNVTRFSVFFPERRQFFLENASLFGIGISRQDDGSGGNLHLQPFFSRRIGLDPQGRLLPIEAGARYVYRSDKRNAGVMAIRQGASASEPVTNFFVGRFSENIGAQGRIGGLLTIKDNAKGSNRVATVDGFFRRGEAHSLNSMVSVSQNAGEAKPGLAAALQYFFVNNQWKIWWTQSMISKRYDPQMGFVSRGDVIATTPGIFYYYRGKKLPFQKYIRAFEPGIMPEYYHQASTGRLLESSWMLNPVWLNFQNGAYLGYLIVPTFQYLPEPFRPLGLEIAPGAYRYTRHMLFARTDASRPVNLELNGQWGSYFDGQLLSADAALQIAPAPQFSFTGRLNRNHFSSVGVRSEAQTVDLFSIEARLALNPRLQLIGFYQQNTENKAKNYNIRFSWEYTPLSYIYLVLNHRGFQTIQDKLSREDQAILKISYLKQL